MNLENGLPDAVAPTPRGFIPDTTQPHRPGWPSIEAWKKLAPEDQAIVCLRVLVDALDRADKSCRYYSPRTDLALVNARQTLAEMDGRAGGSG